MMRFLLLTLMALTVLLSSSVDAKTINFRWTKKTMKASGMGGKRNINPKKKIMNVCSRDVVHFKWSGEQMGLYGFYTQKAFRQCAKGNLNYMKNTRPQGAFKTKANRSGCRYYAHIGGAGDGACKYGCGNKKNKTNYIKGTCEQRVTICWNKC